MKTIAAVVVGAGLLGVYMLTRALSSDALGMAVGLLFGALAGVPTMLLTIYAMQSTPAQAQMVERPAVITVERPVVRRVSDGRHKQRRLEVSR